MKSQLKRIVSNLILVLGVIIVTEALRGVSFDNRAIKKLMEFVSVSLYFALLAYWGIAIMKRIMHERVRRYLIASDLLMILWVFIRSLKWYVMYQSALSHVLGYLYYVPFLGIVYCFFMACECIADLDLDKLRKHRALIFTFSLALMLFTLTNDLHNLVWFTDENSGSTRHNYGYFIVAAWIFLIIVFSVLRLPRNVDIGENKFDKRVLAPYLVLLTGVLYTGYSLLLESLSLSVHPEFTSGFIMLAVGMFESLIQTGMIPSNTDYTWCFNHSTAKVRILNKKGETVYESYEARSLTNMEIEEILNEGVTYPDEDTELVSVPIKGGYAVWERDNTEINRSIKRLSVAIESVKEARESLEESIKIEKRHQAILERNRLYDIIFSSLSDKYAYLLRLIDAAKSLKGEELEGALRLIDICGVFVKRKSNLLLLSETKLVNFNEELMLCFKESFDNLRDCGIKADFHINKEIELNVHEALYLYSALETVLEEYLDSLSYVSAIVSGDENRCTLTLSLSLSKAFNKESLRKIKDFNFDFEEDDENNEITLLFSLNKKNKEVQKRESP